MNPFISKVIINTVLNNKNQYKSTKNPNYSEQDLKKGLNELIITVKRITKDTLFIVTGVFAAGFGLRGFLLPNDFIDGGAMGISLLLFAAAGIF